ncbi:MAG: hypothetical protein IPG28_12395 [Betaproteobacteria bacterium]|nr:hypothetical protein [Betaproteobacteria bacterium]
MAEQLVAPAQALDAVGADGAGKGHMPADAVEAVVVARSADDGMEAAERRGRVARERDAEVTGGAAGAAGRKWWTTIRLPLLVMVRSPLPSASGVNA